MPGLLQIGHGSLSGTDSTTFLPGRICTEADRTDDSRCHQRRSDEESAGMNLHMRDTLLTIAQDCRFTIEGEADRDPLKSMVNPAGLGGWCAISSAQMFRMLQQESIDSEIHMWVCPKTGQSHVFTVVEDHILDVTASQFSIFRNQPICLIHQREIHPKHHWFWNTVEIFSTPEDLIRAQKRNKWPKDQIARNALIVRR